MIVRPTAGVSAIVLAGGRSRRLGTDKALLPFLGKPLIARIASALGELTDDLIVVTNQPARFTALDLPARLVSDERPGLGSLMGIYSGLKQSRYWHALVVACDMPLLSVSLLRHMTTLVAGYDVVIPEVNGMLEPLHAIYGKGVLGPMARQLESGERQIIQFFPQVRVRVLREREIDVFDPEHLSFANVNTRQDWDTIQERLSTGSSYPQ